MAIVSKILTPIPDQAFELVRDRIAEILLVELAAQATLQSDVQVKALLNDVKVFSERFHPLNESEFFGVEIFLFTGDYDNKSAGSARGTYTFYLDCFGRAASTNRDEGDVRSSLKLQKLIGIIRAILESPNWNTLGFTPPNQVIGRTEVKSIKRTEEKNTEDSGNIMFYRIIFDVIATEDTDANVGVPLAQASTIVTIEETTLGLEYIFIAP